MKNPGAAESVGLEIITTHSGFCFRGDVRTQAESLFFHSRLPPRRHWPSHFHANGPAEADRLNKSQWAGANRRTLSPSCTNSICSAVWGCARPALPLFQSTHLSSRHLGNYEVSCFPSFFSRHFARLPVKCTTECLCNQYAKWHIWSICVISDRLYWSITPKRR